MRITFITSSYPRFPGDGTAPFIMSIAEHLARLGHSIEVVAPYDIAARPMPSEGVRVHRFRYVWPDKWHIMGHARSLREDVRLRPSAFFLLPLFLAASLITLWRVTGKQKTHLIYAHWAIPNGLPAAIVAKLRHVPLVISLHGSDMFVARRNPVFRVAARWIFKGATSVTACSPELREAALSLGAPVSTTLLAWGADPDKFNPAKRSTEVRRFLGASQDSVLVAFLGRLVHKKGVNILLRALPTVLAKYPQARVVIAGDGPLLNELTEQAKHLGIDTRVTFPGRVSWERAPEFHAAADIFVQPSIRDKQGNLDGLPTVLLEAMSSETAVIASHLGGIPLVVQDDMNGLLVPPGDVEALTETLGRLISDRSERHRLARAARMSIEQTFNWRSVAQALERLFRAARGAPAFTSITRMGSLYRHEIIALLDKKKVQGRVLDVGCHDCYLLSRLEAQQLVGVDLEFPTVRLGLQSVRGDGSHLPFADSAFDFVFAMDVIEHVMDDRMFAHSITRILAPTGQLFLTTPNESIRITPSFLTGWISRKWGHHLRRGYQAIRLRELFDFEEIDVRVLSWNAPAWRFLYLPLRAVFPLAPHWIEAWLRPVAKWDARHMEGDHGYLLLVAQRKPL